MGILIILAGIAMMGITKNPGWFVLGLIIGGMIAMDTYRKWR